jgi:regulator of sigma E protease
MALTIIVAFISLIGLIVLHELGHFLLAKRFGIKVEEFGIGYPPKLLSKKIGETIYSLNLLPFGAFVKIYGQEEIIDNPRSFSSKPFYQKALVILGGVVVFWIVAAILLSIVMAIGVPSIISDNEAGILRDPKVQVAEIIPDSPASQAGLKIGDSIVNIKCQFVDAEINKVKEVQSAIQSCKGQETVMAIQRGENVSEVSLVPRISPPENEGPIGIALLRTALKSYPWYQAPIEGVRATGNLTVAIVRGWGMVIKSLVSGQGVPAGVEIGGPVRIFELFVDMSALGINYFLQFIALISISLAILNILPIPALDGGWLVFLIVEKLRGKPLNDKIVQKISLSFFFLLIILMIWITVKDVIRLF